MDDIQIKEILSIYQNAQMKCLDPSCMEGWNHVFSRRFQKRMKRLLRYEKRFGKHYHRGYLIRRLAVIAIVVLSAAVANVAIAQDLYGFIPWIMDIKYKKDERIITYQAPNKPDDGRVLKERKHNFPTYIPEGYSATILRTPSPYVKLDDPKKDYYCAIEYNKGIEVIIYSCDPNGGKRYVSTPHDWIRKLDIAGYRAELFHYPGDKKDVGPFLELFWHDQTHFYLLVTDSMSEKEPSVTSDELIRMAESLYH